RNAGKGRTGGGQRGTGTAGPAPHAEFALPTTGNALARTAPGLHSNRRGFFGHLRASGHAVTVCTLYFLGQPSLDGGAGAGVGLCVDGGASDPGRSFHCHRHHWPLLLDRSGPALPDDGAAAGVGAPPAGDTAAIELLSFALSGTELPGPF